MRSESERVNVWTVETDAHVHLNGSEKSITSSKSNSDSFCSETENRCNRGD